MPVIVIGADTPLGGHVMDALLGREGEIRAFVTDPEVGMKLKDRGAKVATGDVSDGSHVGSASLGAFCAVVMSEAASDDRERSFAADTAAVLDGWAEALTEASVRRVIWVGDEAPALDELRSRVPEVAAVSAAGRDPGDVANEVAALDEAAQL